MKSLLDRRLNSRLDSERIRVREEEVDKVEGRVCKRVADEVREEVVVQVREELKPDLDRVEEERNRIRDEERAVPVGPAFEQPVGLGTHPGTGGGGG